MPVLSSVAAAGVQQAREKPHILSAATVNWEDEITHRRRPPAIYRPPLRAGRARGGVDFVEGGKLPGVGGGVDFAAAAGCACAGDALGRSGVTESQAELGSGGGAACYGAGGD